jgi:hypothetical protein
MHFASRSPMTDVSRIAMQQSPASILAMRSVILATVETRPALERRTASTSPLSSDSTQTLTSRAEAATFEGACFAAAAGGAGSRVVGRSGTGSRGLVAGVCGDGAGAPTVTGSRFLAANRGSRCSNDRQACVLCSTSTRLAVLESGSDTFYTGARRKKRPSGKGRGPVAAPHRTRRFIARGAARAVAAPAGNRYSSAA